MLPRLVQIGPITLYSFGLMVVLGFVVGTALAARLARRRGLPGEAFFDAGVVTLLAGVIGARLLFVLLNWADYSTRVWEIASVWQGGMSFHGGAIAGILAGCLYFRARKLPLLAMADAGAPGLAVGYAFGRVGCLLNGCCYGAPTHLPWGLPFPDGVPGVHYHPTQLYAIPISLALAGLLAAVYVRPHHRGQVMALYVVGYSAYRFGIEFLRKGVTAEVLAFGLTQAQVFSLLAIAAGVAWWLWLRGRTPVAPALSDGPVRRAAEHPPAAIP